MRQIPLYSFAMLLLALCVNAVWTLRTNTDSNSLSSFTDSTGFQNFLSDNAGSDSFFFATELGDDTPDGDTPDDQRPLTFKYFICDSYVSQVLKAISFETLPSRCRLDVHSWRCKSLEVQWTWCNNQFQKRPELATFRSTFVLELLL